MPAGIRSKSESMPRRPSGIGRSYHIGDLKAGGVQTFNRFVVLVQNLMLAVGV